MQKGITVYLIILISVVVLAGIGLVGYSMFYNQKSKTPKEITPDKLINNTGNNTDRSSWATYHSPDHNFSFAYPSERDWLVEENAGHGGALGQFGSAIIGKGANTGEYFVVDVLYTPEWTTVGNRYGDVDSLEEGYRSGGVEKVASLSRQVNLQKKENFPDKQVGELKAFQYENGKGYGFTVTGSFAMCFNVNLNCSSGKVLNLPTTIVYVTNGQDIYKIEFPTSSLGGEIFTTFRFTL
jgi:hypothetical protein